MSSLGIAYGYLDVLLFCEVWSDNYTGDKMFCKGEEGRSVCGEECHPKT